MKLNRKQWVMTAILIVLAGLIIWTATHPADLSNLEEYVSPFHSTALALLPPISAIALALITKEVYSSLFLGIICGALLYSNFNLELMYNTMLFADGKGLIYKLADSWNVGILVFLVLLGVMVSAMNKAGGSAAFGEWASKRIHTRAGAQVATMALGVLIFVDDYFNCLTVGSVMRPVTDSHKVSRAKLAYLIDATAAPICIIAPISSWAAAVTSSVPSDSGINGFQTFLRTIPYNYYALLTLFMIIYISVRKFDYGPMLTHELNAIRGDLYTTADRPYADHDADRVEHKGKVIDLVLPVLVLIALCIIGMVYTGGFFSGVDFVTAFANADASMGLVMGGLLALLFTFFFYMIRDVLEFREFMDCIPEGFKAMVAPILILSLAWTLSGMTNLLGADVFVAGLVENSAHGLANLLPAMIFLISLGLAFATGTSWGTFGILIPIVIGVFPSGEMMIISIAACLAGSVCGDHCSPISDTTIMASAGAQCSHVNHVATQLPYALTAAAASFVAYLIAGVVKNPIIGLVCAFVIMLLFLLYAERALGNSAEAQLEKDQAAADAENN